MSKLCGFTGAVSIVIGFLYLVLMFFIDNESGTKQIFIIFLQIAVFGIFWVAGILCWLYYKNHKVVYDDYGVEVQSMFGSTKYVSWKNIRRVKFNRFSDILIIENGTDKLKIHQHLIGFRKFISKLEEKTTFIVRI